MAVSGSAAKASGQGNTATHTEQRGSCRNSGVRRCLREAGVGSSHASCAKRRQWRSQFKVCGRFQTPSSTKQKQSHLAGEAVGSIGANTKVPPHQGKLPVNVQISSVKSLSRATRSVSRNWRPSVWPRSSLEDGRTVCLLRLEQSVVEASTM